MAALSEQLLRRSSSTRRGSADGSRSWSPWCRPPPRRWPIPLEGRQSCWKLTLEVREEIRRQVSVAEVKTSSFAVLGSSPFESIGLVGEPLSPGPALVGLCLMLHLSKLMPMLK